MNELFEGVKFLTAVVFGVIAAWFLIYLCIFLLTWIHYGFAYFAPGS